jgi:hypothetical protein
MEKKMKRIRLMIAALFVSTAAPAFADVSDLRQIAAAADRLSVASERLANSAYRLGRAHFGNLSIDVSREAAQLANIARRSIGTRNPNAVVRAEWVDVRTEFAQLRQRWQTIAPSVREPVLRNQWQVTQARFQALRTQIQD